MELSCYQVPASFDQKHTRSSVICTTALNVVPSKQTANIVCVLLLPQTGRANLLPLLLQTQQATQDQVPFPMSYLITVGGQASSLAGRSLAAGLELLWAWGLNLLSFPLPLPLFLPFAVANFLLASGFYHL
ncbi:hypothetical protein Tco_1274628 [Tanacetum coccineum]